MAREDAITVSLHGGGPWAYYPPNKDTDITDLLGAYTDVSGLPAGSFVFYAEEKQDEINQRIAAGEPEADVIKAIKMSEEEKLSRPMDLVAYVLPKRMY